MLHPMGNKTLYSHCCVCTRVLKYSSANTHPWHNKDEKYETRVCRFSFLDHEMY